MWFLDVSLRSSSSSVFELLLIRLERGGGGSILIMRGGAGGPGDVALTGFAKSNQREEERR